MQLIMELLSRWLLVGNGLLLEKTYQSHSGASNRSPWRNRTAHLRLKHTIKHFTDMVFDNTFLLFYCREL